MQTDHSESEYEYTWEEFAADFGAWVSSQAPAPNTEYNWRSYFAERYPDSDEALYKKARLCVAVMYLERHFSSPVFAEFLVLGEMSLLVAHPLVEALWHYFGAIPENYLHSDPPVERILRLAKGEQF